MKFGCLVIFCLAAAVFALPAAAQERAADEVIRVNTTLVSVPVIVSDRQGRYISNLAQAEFGILQDGVEQRIDFFATAAEPINIALLIDTSQSTRNVLGDIRSAAKKMVKLLNADDKAMIVSFDYEPHFLSPLTSDKEELEKAIKNADVPDDFGTTLRDAVDDTVRNHFADVKGRKAIIVLTDGKDHGSYITQQGLIHSLQESDVIVYTVFFNTTEFRRRHRPDFGDRGIYGGSRGGIYGGGMSRNERDPRFPPDDRRRNSRRAQRAERENENAIDFLNKLSDATAGRFYDSKTTKFTEAFASIVNELRHQYRLGYYAPEETGNGAVHSLKVKVMRPDLVVRARTTYRPKAK